MYNLTDTHTQNNTDEDLGHENAFVLVLSLQNPEGFPLVDLVTLILKSEF